MEPCLSHEAGLLGEGEDVLYDLVHGELCGVDDGDARGGIREVDQRRVVPAASQHLIAEGSFVERPGELGPATGHATYGIGDEQHAYDCVGAHHCGDVAPLHHE